MPGKRRLHETGFIGRTTTASSVVTCDVGVLNIAYFKLIGSLVSACNNPSRILLLAVHSLCRVPSVFVNAPW